MSELYDSIRLTRSAATFTRALGIDAPDGADAPCDIVLDKLFAELGEGGADRVFIYNPDASRTLRLSVAGVLLEALQNALWRDAGRVATGLAPRVSRR